MPRKELQLRIARALVQCEERGGEHGGGDGVGKLPAARTRPAGEIAGHGWPEGRQQRGGGGGGVGPERARK